MLLTCLLWRELLKFWRVLFLLGNFIKGYLILLNDFLLYYSSETILESAFIMSNLLKNKKSPQKSSFSLPIMSLIVSMALCLSGCNMSSQTTSALPDVHRCLDRCDVRFTGNHQRKRECENACMNMNAKNVLTTSRGMSLSLSDDGKNSLNERNITATLA